MFFFSLETIQSLLSILFQILEKKISRKQSLGRKNQLNEDIYESRGI